MPSQQNFVQGWQRPPGRRTLASDQPNENQPGRFYARELFVALARYGVNYSTVGWTSSCSRPPLETFADIRASAHKIPLGDLSIPIAHRDDLLKMKRAAGRPQDLADVKLLESLNDAP